MLDFSFAFQLLDSELFCITEKNNLSDAYQQIFIINRKPIKPSHLNGFLLLDRKNETTIINKRINKLMQDSLWKYNYNYIAKIDSQIEFENNVNIINELLNKYAPGSSLKIINKEYSSSLSLYIVFIKVYKIPKSFKYIQNNKILNSTIIYRLKETTENKSINENDIVPVVSNNYFEYIRDEVIHILKSNGIYLDIYKNNDEGNKKLLKRFEFEYSISEKSLKNDKKHHHDRAKIDYQDLYRKICEIEPNMSFIVDKIKRIIPPQIGENNVLLRALKKGDKTVIKRIFESHLRLILNIAYKYRNKLNETIEDCFQEGAIGLLEAIKKYDITAGQPFGAYCSYWIMQPMERMEHVLERAFRLPEHFKSKIIPIFNYIQNNDLELNYEGFLDEKFIEQVSKHFCIDKDNLKEIIKYCYIPLSYEDYCINKNTDEGYFAEEIQTELEHILIKKETNKIINSLKQRERDVIIRRNGLQNQEIATLQEIADLYGLTRERVRQIESKAMKNFRTKLLKSFIPDFWGYTKNEFLTLFDDDIKNDI